MLFISRRFGRHWTKLSTGIAWMSCLSKEDRNTFKEDRNTFVAREHLLSDRTPLSPRLDLFGERPVSTGRLTPAARSLIAACLIQRYIHKPKPTGVSPCCKSVLAPRTSPHHPAWRCLAASASTLAKACW